MIEGESGSTVQTGQGYGRSSVRSVFFGGQGLRAGWSLLLFVMLVAGLLSLETMVVRRIPPAAHTAAGAAARGPSARTTLLNDGLIFAALVASAWVMSRLERRRFKAYGFAARAPLQLVLGGAAWGLLALSALVGTLRVFHLLVFDGMVLQGSAIVKQGLGWGVAFLMVGFMEEFLTRGYLQYTLARGIRGLLEGIYEEAGERERVAFWIAAVLFSALLFMAMHTQNRGETAIGIVAVGAAGLTFAYSLWRTGSLWWAIGFHAAWDWAQSFLFGVADSGTMVQGHLLTSHAVGDPRLSGGVTGPEGSIFVLPTLLLVCLVIRATLGRSDERSNPDPSDTRLH